MVSSEKDVQQILVTTLLTKENTKNPQLAQVELVETRSAF